MLKVLINEEEVLTNKDFTIKKEMLNTPSVILNNVYPKSWEDEKDYTSNFYHPQDYSKCKIIDETIIPASDGETITGTSFTIQDYDSTKLVELTELDGNTTQSGTPTPNSPQPINVVSGRQEVNVVGKNLLDISDITNGNGITNNNNKSITLQGGVTSTSFTLKKPFVLKANTTYTLSITNTNSSYSASTFILRNGNTNIFLINYNVSSVHYTPTEDKIIDTLRIFNGNNVFDNFTFSVQLEKSSTASEYEEYKGTTYEINLGKNLFDSSSIIMKDYVGSNPTIRASSRQSLYLQAGTYTFSTNLDLTTYGVSLDILPNSPPSSSYNSIQTTGYITNSTKTFTVNTSGYFVATFKKGSNQTFTLDEITQFNFQLEKGSQATSYASYKTPIELCKIGTYQDRIYKGKGVNLCPINTFTSTSTARIVSSATSGQTVNGISVVAGQKYTASFDVSTLPSGTDYRIQFINSPNATETQGTADPTRIDREQINCNALQRYSVSITPTQNGYLYLRCVPVGFVLNNIQIEKGDATEYEPYNSKGKWYIEKNIGKVVLNGNDESYMSWHSQSTGNTRLFGTNTYDNLQNKAYIGLSNYFVSSSTSIWATDSEAITIGNTGDQHIRIRINKTIADDTMALKNWLSAHNTIVYYVLATPTTTEITDSELISQLNAIELLEGLNNVSVSSAYLPSPITIHYNYNEKQIIDDLLFCGVVKNSGNISLNPRQPHFQSLQILDFKTFLSEGELDSFVIYQKTILEAIQTVIANIQDYGFILGNVNILNPTDIIGAYSTKDKTAYDVFNYIADITQSRWTTRLIDENHVAIDFYDPTLMVEGTPINYTQTFFEDNLIDDMTYSYGSNNYRNKQIMTSSQVYSNISQQQSIVANGYQTQFPTEQPIGKINSITSNGIPLTFATFNEKEMGYVADFYYQPGENYFESEDLRSTGEILIIDYVAIVEGRQIITNPLEIDRISDSTGRKGIISRYEQRNDATTSTELQKIGESYIKYKGTPEIKLKISTRKNIWEVGQRVQFNAPITELDTEYMIRTKKINYISTIDTIFYEYELISSFNSETEINYFDNQRAKASGNIGEGEYISRNIDIESTANIIFYDTETTEVQVDGDNVLNSILNSPFIS